MMADVKLKLGDRPGAVEYCKKAISKVEADEKQVSKALSAMHAMLGPKEVREYCEQKLQSDPDSLTANYTMFNLSKMNDEYNKAIDYIDKCLQIIDPDDPKNIEFSIQKSRVLQAAYIKTSDNSYFNRVREVYESLLEKMPNNIDILNNLTYLLVINDRELEKALEYGERLYELAPDRPDYLDTYAFALYKNGKFEESERFLNTAIQHFEQRGELARSEMYEHLGMAKQQLGETNQAIEAYKQALKVGEGKLPETKLDQLRQKIDELSSY